MVSCSRNENYIYKVDLPNLPKTLDPQLAVDYDSVLIIKNLFRGLVKISSDGKIIKDVAEDYILSEDSKKYTFYLDDKNRWSDGEYVTSGDFKYAIQRIFDIKLESPHKDKFISIKNASSILAGEASLDELGVYINGDYELSIELEYRDNNFLNNLAGVGGMPCNRDFFESTNGKYALDKDSIRSNGNYYINEWEKSSYIALRKNKFSSSFSKISAVGISFIVEDEDQSVKRFKNNETDFLFLDGYKYSKSDINSNYYSDLDDNIWGIGFNFENQILADIDIRRAIYHSFDQNSYKDFLPDDYIPQDSFFNLNRSSNLDQDGYLDLKNKYFKKIKKTDFNNLNIVIPNIGIHYEIFSYISQILQKELNLFLDIRVLDFSDYYKAIEESDYDLILLEYKKSNNYYDFFAEFISSNNKLNYKSNEYDNLLREFLTKKEADKEDQLLLLEEKLTSDIVFIPIYSKVNLLFYRDKKLKNMFNIFDKIIYFE